MELITLVLVLGCVYASELVWWMAPDSLMLTGSRMGEFTVRYGPSLPVRNGSGFSATRFFPPFGHSFECELVSHPDANRKPVTRQSVERIATRALDAAAPLRQLGQGLWLYLFALAPLAIGIFGVLRVWVPLLGGLFLWLVVIVVTYRRAWQTLHADNPSGWRSDGVLMVLSPPGAIHAADRLTRKALTGMSAMRATSVIASREEFCRIARLVYFGESAEDQPAAKREIEQILELERLDTMLDDPPDREPGMEGYCPRCLGQLLRRSGNCPDCVGVAVRAFGT